MSPASQTTADVVQPELQPPLQTPLEEVSAQCAGFKVRLKTWLASFFSQHIPAGYEDEMGFHYGADSQDHQID